MFVVAGRPDENDSSVRTHPWTVTDYEGGGRYVDFIEHPELIETSLEDFISHAQRPAIRRFYQLLRSINSPGGALETNDSALRAIHASLDTVIPCKLKLDGRVELLIRDHQHNTRVESFNWLVDTISLYLQAFRPDFHRAILKLDTPATEYIRLPELSRRGQRLRIVFNAYGDTADEAWDSLDTIFEGIGIASERISLAIKGSLTTIW